MEASEPVKVKRPRGRPPKIKRGGFKGVAQPTVIALVQNLQDGSAIGATHSPCGGSSGEAQRTPNQPLSSTATLDSTTHISPQREPSGSQIVMSDKVRLPESSLSHTPKSDAASDSRSGPRNVILPARRSARQATVHATQVSEGTLRPPGPPHLEAALSIALRNLESETWGYLWSYNEKRQGERLPTPAEIKAASRSVRRAAEAVDKADNDLEDAIDEIISVNSKKKRRGPVLSKYIDKPLDTDSSAAPTPTPTTQEMEITTSRKGKERERYLPPGSLPELGATVNRGLSPISTPRGTSPIGDRQDRNL